MHASAPTGERSCRVPIPTRTPSSIWSAACFWRSAGSLALVLVAWAGVDYLLLWLKSEGDLKMSRQEIRDEIKQSEGNPANKAKIRRLQRQSRRRQMIKAAETATVVITNPTHYAVALRYEMAMSAPIVVAKGMNLLAQKIKAIAWDHDIPVMENRPLAQALYKGAEVGDTIPSALYHAVAEILVMVYKAQAEVKQRDAQRQSFRQPARRIETPVNTKPGLLTSLRASGDWIIPTAAVALVFVMLVPMPSIVLDLLLTVSITASVLVLLTAIQILRPVQFSVFPSLILLLTLMRLSLDLASTRRILLHGNEGHVSRRKGN